MVIDETDIGSRIIELAEVCISDEAVGDESAISRECSCAGWCSTDKSIVMDIEISNIVLHRITIHPGNSKSGTIGSIGARIVFHNVIRNLDVGSL